MDEVEKMKYRIIELQKRLETNARMQRNYQRNKCGKIKEKLELEAMKYMEIINLLRDELKILEGKMEVGEDIKKMSVVAIGETMVLIG